VRKIRFWLDELQKHPEMIHDGSILPVDYRAINATHDMLMKDCLLGMNQAGPRGDFADDLPIDILPFEEAIDILNSKIPLSRDDYYALDDKLRFRAFTVGRLNDGDAINRVKGIMEKGLLEGATMKDYYSWTDDEILSNIGFGKGEMAYWETVYRTNEQSVHNAGRAMGYESYPPIAIELVGINDMRQSGICRELTNPPFIRSYGDPIWKTLWPPFHFSCRTFPRAIYDRAEFEEYGGMERAYSQGNYAAPQKGFGGYPLDKETWWQLTPEMWDRAEEYGIVGEIVSVAKKLGLERYAQELMDDVYVSNTGGVVKKLSKARPSEKEMDLAKKAADRGHDIVFLSESNTPFVKSPDILLDNDIADIKQLTSLNKERISDALSDAARKNATSVLMEISKDIPLDSAVSTIKDKMRQNKINHVVLRWNNAFYDVFKE